MLGILLTTGCGNDREPSESSSPDETTSTDSGGSSGTDTTGSEGTPLTPSEANNLRRLAVNATGIVEVSTSPIFQIDYASLGVPPFTAYVTVKVTTSYRGPAVGSSFRLAIDKQFFGTGRPDRSRWLLFVARPDPVFETLNTWVIPSGKEGVYRRTGDDAYAAVDGDDFGTPATLTGDQLRDFLATTNPGATLSTDG